MTKFKTQDILQANTLKIAADVLALMDAGINENAELSRLIGIHAREIDYYKHATRILGFTQLNRNHKFVVTDRGNQYLKAKRPQEKIDLINEAVREAPVFRELLQDRTPSELNRFYIEEFLRSNTNLSGTTPARRAASYIAWLRQINLTDPEDFGTLAQGASKVAKEEYDRYISHEEGDRHKSLKLRLAEQPELLESKLRLVQIEYMFPTNDRADILFIDKRSRFVAVEVETDIGPMALAGLLQAAKYRVMLAIQFGIKADHVRAMLAAYTIHPAMKERASKYAIDPREFPEK
jgi:hypothetical protein